MHLQLKVGSSIRSTRPNLVDVEDLFSGFADPTRIRIMNLLAAGELCVCDLVEILTLPQPLVSRHLAFLRKARLVEVTRASKFAHYRLAEPRNSVHRNLVDCLQSCFTGIGSLAGERRVAHKSVSKRKEEPCQ